MSIVNSKKPTDITSLILWLDMDQESSLSSGQSISSLTDYSSRNSNIVGVTGKLPLVSVQGGKKAVYFNGSTSLKISNYVASPQNLSVFIVVSYYSRIFLEHGSPNTTTGGFYLYSAGTGFWIVRNSSIYKGESFNSVGNSMDNYVTKTRNFNTLGFIHKNNNVCTSIIGDVIYRENSTTNLPSGNITSDFFIGSRNGTGLFSTGHLHELIIYDKSLSNSELYQLRDYINKKYKYKNLNFPSETSLDDSIHFDKNSIVNNYLPMESERAFVYNGFEPVFITEKSTSQVQSNENPRLFPPLDKDITEISVPQVEPLSIPINDSPSLWIDSRVGVLKSDRTTQDVDNGEVSFWGFVGNSANEFVSNTSVISKPVIHKNVFGKVPAIYFNGNSGLLLDDIKSPKVNNLSFFFVVKSLRPRNNNAKILTKRLTDTTFSYSISNNLSSPEQKSLIYNNSSSNAVSISDFFDFGVSSILSIIDGDNEQHIYNNGVNMSSTSYPSLKTFDNTKPLQLGFSSLSSGVKEGADFYLGSLIVFNKKLTNEERIKMEVYLSDAFNIPLLE